MRSNRIGILSLVSFSFLVFVCESQADSCTKPPGCYSGPSCECEIMVCRPIVEMKPVKKYCWEVECEYICVPKVRLPLFDWLKGRSCGETCEQGGQCGSCGTSGCSGACCGPLCAKVRKVHRLKKVSYECEERVVTWKLERSCIGECGSCKINCDGSVTFGCSPTSPQAALPPAPAQAP